MRVLTAWFALVVFLAAPTASGAWVSDYDALLEKYVSSDGVRYKAWKAHAGDLAKLRVITDEMSRERVVGMKRNDRLAFYLNVYNAWILRTAVEKYPVKSLKGSQWGFFKKDRFTLGGKKMSFDDLEHDVIRPTFADARVHFALNCGARSCPPLHDKAFRGSSLDATLTALTKRHLNHWRGVNEKKGKVHVTKLFDWFEKDFAQSGGSVEGFIGEYRKLPGKIDGFLSYDWSLNETK